MNIKVDWSQPSTIRGVVWVSVAVLSAIFIALGDYEKAQQFGTLGGLVAGGLGVAIKD